MTKDPLFFHFTKMHGLGNDFVIFDFRTTPLYKNFLTPSFVRNMADRREGIGCDQVVVMTQDNQEEIPFLSFFNKDGSEAETCGNGSRCAFSLLLPEGNNSLVCRTKGGTLTGNREKNGFIRINMGTPRFQWSAIPLASDMDTMHLPIELSRIHYSGEGITQKGLPQAVNMGNPHLVFFVEPLERGDWGLFGSLLEQHILFPERTNVNFAQILSPQEISLQVWERGTGLTPSCGSGACATAVAAYRQGFTDEKVIVHQPGGSLEIQWDQKTGNVMMAGPVAHVFEGSFRADIFQTSGRSLGIISHG